MLQRLEINRRPIENVLIDRTITAIDMQRKLKIDDELILFEGLNPVLQILEMANTVLCAGKTTTVSVSMVRSLMDKLVNSHLQPQGKLLAFNPRI